jgi:WD40 repeat protein
VDPSGDLLAGACRDGTVRIWPLNHAGPSATLRAHDGRAWSAVFVPGTDLLATAGNDGRVTLWDLAVLRPLLRNPSAGAAPDEALRC